MTTFNQFPLRAEIQNTLAANSFTTPTPIQAQAIPHGLEGKDVLGIAQTGTGKTLAFALPILQKLASEGPPRANHAHALILAPTRELAVQIADNFKKFTPRLNMKLAVILGGVGQQRQVDDMRRGADIIVATPGRLLDLMNQNIVHLSMLKMLVLDEADRMLDMGFIHDIRRIMQKLPPERQTMFFSATMPREVGELSNKLLKNPIRVEVAPVASTADRVEQSVIHVEAPAKRAVLVDLLADTALERVIVFTRTKHGADRVAKHLEKSTIQCGVIHGNKSQNARQNALNGFAKGKLRVLVATDIAARGIDVRDISHVINFDLPDEPESYVHRIGRTARAGKAGIAIAFCAGDERSQLRDIEKLTRQQIPVVAKPAQTQAPEAYLPSAGANGNDREHSRGPRQHGGGHRGGQGGGNNRFSRNRNRNRGARAA